MSGINKNIKGDFVTISKINSDSYVTCEYCKMDEIQLNKIKMVQCGHYYHIDCISKILYDKMGEYVDIVTVDKTLFFDDLKSNEFTKMILIKEQNDNFNFACCGEEYSVNTPIYRDFGIPKKIIKKIIFDEYAYHLCTNVDLIHLIDDLNDQYNLLNEFDYSNENKLDNLINYDIFYNLLDNDCYIFHAVSNNGVVEFLEHQKCHACKNELNYSHITINDYFRLLYLQ